MPERRKTCSGSSAIYLPICCCRYLLIGWLAQNHDAMSTLFFVASVLVALFLAFLLAHVNRQAYRRLKDLEDA